MAKRRKRLTRDHLGRFWAGTSVTNLRRAKRRIGGRRRRRRRGGKRRRRRRRSRGNRVLEFYKCH